ncbi:Vacuolar protein sorting-associated protein VTA1 [Blattella germanica]|nr:Vacuolar protein sorting-associated protein VTA1 [Blattella germanica]
MSAQLPPCPASLKSIQHYLKTASEHDNRDPVVSYWCRLYALQTGLKVDRKSDEAKALLTALMDWLETNKKALADNEAISHELAAQAHIENYALKLFVYADTQDRAANFGKKYAKWKAAYIHNCLKNGETPVPGPMKTEGEDEEEDALNDEENAAYGGPATRFVRPPDPPSSFDPPAPNTYVPPTTPSRTPTSQPGGFMPFNPTHIPTTPTDVGPSSFPGYSNYNTAGNGNGGTTGEGGVKLTPEQITKAQKYCKWAGSALNYDDVSTAVTNLQKALRLLQTGQDG